VRRSWNALHLTQHPIPVFKLLILPPFAAAIGEWIKDDQQDKLSEA
jgi:hypothetical protein